MSLASPEPIIATARTDVRRHPERAIADRAVAYAILDEALVCHVGFVDEGHPFVIPTIHVRVGDELFLHGSPGSRMLRCLAAGVSTCVTVTLVDGLVLARTAFHHSMNYRSVVILGRAAAVEDRQRKRVVLDALVEQVVPGRTADLPTPTRQDLDATMVVSLPLTELSVKSRNGPPKEDERRADQDSPIWTGVIPLRVTPETAETALDSHVPTPPGYVTRYARPVSVRGATHGSGVPVP